MTKQLLAKIEKIDSFIEEIAKSKEQSTKKIVNLEVEAFAPYNASEFLHFDEEWKIVKIKKIKK